ncbi:MAG: hypothetical protein ABFS18_06510 [Thermodesulfobacteriota bacterium]
MSTLRLFAIGFLAFAVSGCGQLVSERLAVSASANPEKCTSKKMVILPFADYSYTKDAERAFRRNINIMENLTAGLTGKGFRLPVQEDLLAYLAETNVATLNSDLSQNSALPGYIQDAISNDSSWSSLMKSELADMVEKEQPRSNSNQASNYALDSATLAKIADNFNADFVMRGQILSYEFDQENTWSPLKRGIMPVLFAGSSKALFGVTNSDTYDSLGSALMSGAAGAVIGYNASGPYDYTEKLNPGRHNSMIWGMGGAALGYVASKGGKANQAAIQLRLWVQDPQTAEVVWTNSVKVLVKPQTVFAETREDKLFDTAVQQAIAALINDFASKSSTVL